MKFPTNVTNYKWTETRTLGRVYCGRSLADSGPYKSPSRCEQSNTDATSEHYLTGLLATHFGFTSTGDLVGERRLLGVLRGLLVMLGCLLLVD
jgi:hypothetical protein